MKNIARGVDIGWLPVMEERGYVFRDFDGRETELIPFLSSIGVNALRQRVWVNPDDDWQHGKCDLAAAIRMGQRARDAGMDFMVDFHYSDTWADPRVQSVPAAWREYGIDRLAHAVYEYTANCLTQMERAGVRPKWVQTGNEIDCGMMKPLGDPRLHPECLARLIRAGYDAVHDALPGAVGILHLSSGYFKDLTLEYLSAVKKYGGAFDMLGSSFYPQWAGGLDLLIRAGGDVSRLTKESMAGREPVSYARAMEMARESYEAVRDMFGVDTMAVEIGAPVGNEAAARQVLDDMLRCAEEDASPLRGIFYWEPEAWKAFSGYDACAWRDDGVPSDAMRAYIDSKARSTL